MTNPTYDKVQDDAELAREKCADVILAVGGGSVMDCCKAVSLAARYEGPSIALIYKASRNQTVVPVVPIGKITLDVSVFEEYGGIITIELIEELTEELPGEENGEE